MIPSLPGQNWNLNSIQKIFVTLEILILPSAYIYKCMTLYYLLNSRSQYVTLNFKNDIDRSFINYYLIDNDIVYNLVIITGHYPRKKKSR